FFFFFQAEDGIRDFHVTGVQTCALPISAAVAPCDLDPIDPRRALHVLEERFDDAVGLGEGEAFGVFPVVADRAGQVLDRLLSDRSEERRVGSEWRFRWSWD